MKKYFKPTISPNDLCELPNWDLLATERLHLTGDCISILRKNHFLSYVQDCPIYESVK